MRFSFSFTRWDYQFYTKFHTVLNHSVREWVFLVCGSHLYNRYSFNFGYVTTEVKDRNFVSFLFVPYFVPWFVLSFWHFHIFHSFTALLLPSLFSSSIFLFCFFSAFPFSVCISPCFLDNFLFPSLLLFLYFLPTFFLFYGLSIYGLFWCEDSYQLDCWYSVWKPQLDLNQIIIQ